MSIEPMSSRAPTHRMGRWEVPGARSPFPLEHQIPAMLMDDPLICAFLRALDEVIAPVIQVLDCFDAYLDPHLAPPDMVSYLGSWILADIEDVWSEDAIREDVARAHDRAVWAGTAHALRERLVPRITESVEIGDPGDTLVSTMGTDPATWSDASNPVVQVVAASGDPERIRRIISRLAPANVALEVQTA